MSSETAWKARYARLWNAAEKADAPYRALSHQEAYRQLALPGLPGPDAADALGLAICHAHAAGSFAAIARSATLAPRMSGRYKSGRTY